MYFTLVALANSWMAAANFWLAAAKRWVAIAMTLVKCLFVECELIRVLLTEEIDLWASNILKDESK
jgi:hypothetical protein